MTEHNLTRESYQTGVTLSTLLIHGRSIIFTVIKIKHAKTYADSVFANLSLLLLVTSGVLLFGLLNPIGWLTLAVGLAVTQFAHKEFKKYISLIYASLGLISLFPITTETTNANYFRMGLSLGLAVAIPYLVSRYIYKERKICFRFHLGRGWLKTEIAYVFVAGILAYLIIPFYLVSSGAYLNWGVENTSDSIFRLFIGTNALGIWDELFFISTVFGVFRGFVNFKTANFLQAILFTSFLYDLGFTGWGPFLIFPFALLQGLIFKKTESLLYVITIHLTIDLVLFLALVNAHHPGVFDIFIT
jgi:membrane protease YdiL (CAAX protease family)